MQQAAFYTYPLGQKLCHTSMWLTPSAREWLQKAAIDGGMSQALVVDALIRDYRLRQMAQTSARFSVDYIHDRAEVDELMAFFPS